MLAWAVPAQAEERSALIVGVNQGLSDDEPLQFAESDAKNVAEVISEVGMLPRARTSLLRHPNLESLRQALQAIETSPPDDLFVFYLSAHGDSDGAHIRGEVLPWRELSQQLARIRSRRVLAVVDACHSGALLTAKGLLRGPPVNLSVEPLGPSGHFLITSSGSNEASYESTWLQGSPFTHLLVSGLRGAADLDGDRRVTLDELYRFLYQRSIAATLTVPSGPQHPGSRSELEGSGEWILSEVGARALVLRGSASQGTCYALDDEGARVLAELPAGRASVALPPGRYRFVCVTGTNGLSSANAELPASGLSLDQLHFAPGERTYALAKGPTAIANWGPALEVGPRVGSAWRTGAEVAASFRREQGMGAFDLQLGADLRDGWLMLLGGFSAQLPWWNLAVTRLDLGLVVGGETTPTSHSGLELALLFGPALRLQLPLSDSSSAFVRLTVLTDLPLESGQPTPVGLLTLGVFYDLAPP
jgi:hypothetical protein